MVTSLESLQDAVNYADWIFSLIEPHLGERVLEIGAGHGTFTDRLRGDRRITATELSGRCVSMLRGRYRDAVDVDVVESDVEGIAALGTFDTAVLINVLEHISDDSRAIIRLYDALKPGGRLVLFVPALPWLYSDFDRRVGHFRRYRRTQLESLVTGSGLTVVELCFVNSIGALAWWVTKQLRLTPTKRWPTLVYDRTAVPILRRVERRWKPPLGQSLFCVATRPP
jgi:SAM-dependent methyltransferase